MTEISKTKSRPYDLEERTYTFAKECRDFVKVLPKNLINIEYSKQLIRSSASGAANYIEANESASKKDFAYRIKICRKETKESCLWLKLFDFDNLEFGFLRDNLLKEAFELRKIFSSILEKSK